ncbi:Alcohol dehydrogenase cytochrome c subunit precursor (plasmid) [Hartmannibacter diazotrophicus]|uniref:Alcohol dehydrogenase cytochrome c subunit n=1 Tax=Hartmannibacter diazotrophicus TaxID=1482074 RepID=A0A2C9DE47_9HYPH|nr:cytochrome c [Hartmannibacter diazotrophicus]SON58479.1 Alcohol dehydrogenase cytochrome c subunit precursor [Hartmannibacter diazotrophicus]
MKRFFLVLLVFCIAAAGGVTWFVNHTSSSPFDSAARPVNTTVELVTRGEAVAREADCVACHSTPDSKPFVGGLEMGTPLGSIFATNITPDKETGIGNYSLADFDRAVRHGVTPDGRRLYPAMPYPSYVKMTDDDIEALYAFFMNSVQPVNQKNRSTSIEWPLNMRWPLALWNAVFVDAGVYSPKPQQDERWNRGAYLVQAAGHCGACHTPRGIAMNEKALDDTSPVFLSGALLDGWYAPSLRQDHNTGLGRWSEEDIYSFLRNGRNQHAIVFGSMTEAYNNSLQFMTDEDLRAISHYLKSLPGDALRDGEHWAYVATSEPASSGSSPEGAQTYDARCAFCHGADGRGQNQWISPLAGAASSLIEQTDSQINVVLNGSGRVVTNGIPDAYRMPPLREQLTDQQIADVLTYVRSAWGNHGGPVKPDDVKTLREHTDPASSAPIVLQMR